MGQHYIDPVQYFLGKDNTSPVKVEVDAPQQHPDAVGTWRSITYTYEDGCQIVLWEVITGIRTHLIFPDRTGMSIRISYVISRIGRKVIRLSRTRATGYRLYRVRKDSSAFCLE